MKEVGIEANLNRWDEPIALGLVDPHDSISYPAGVSDCQTESATHVEPDQFTNFLVPSYFVSNNYNLYLCVQFIDIITHKHT